MRKTILSLAILLALLAAFALPPTLAAQGGVVPYALLTNELEAPMNVEAPRFGWWLRGGGFDRSQTAYQLIVTDDIGNTTVWDSGRAESPEQSYVKYAGPVLLPGHPYSWRVRVWDEAGEASEYSDAARFATGLSDGDWQASWLRPDNTPDRRSYYWYARTQRPLEQGKTPVRALAYFCAQHDYEMWVNGLRIGRGQSFDYQGEQRYQGWDVTEALAREPSSLTVALLCRWYDGGQGRTAHEPGLLGHVAIYYDDGSKQVVTTDETWLTTAATPFTPTSRLRNDEGDTVEYYDARVELPGWAGPGYDPVGWTSPHVLGPHPNELFPRVIAELAHTAEEMVHPVSVTRLKSGVTVADFGRVIPARIGVDFKNGRAGRRLTLKTGYELTRAGRVNTSRAATQDTDMTFVYTMKDGPAAYDSWDHLACRYLEIPAMAGQEFAPEDIRAMIVHAQTPNRRDSALVTSDEMLNRVFELMKRSALYSAQNSFVDTPTREKGQFLQDAVNISAATVAAWYERAVTRKAIEQFLASADRYWNAGEDLGRYNAVYPNTDGKRDIPDFTLNLPLWVWRYYVQTGDRELLALAYPYMKNTADYASRHIPGSGPLAGLVSRLSGGAGKYRFGNIDWPPAGRFGYDTRAYARTTVNALTVGVFDAVAFAARDLGADEAEAREYEARAENLRAAMNEKLITPGGLYCDGLRKRGAQSRHAGQHANSYALAFDIAPEALRDGIASHIASMGMKQGPMTANVLVEALFQSGRADAALRLLTDGEDLGWAWLLDRHDATFTWEQWTVGQHQSQSHGWGAASLAQLLEYVAGVKVTQPGARAVLIHPMTAGLLDDVQGRVVTERGPVEVCYSGSGGEFTLRIDVPVNMRAEVVLPGMEPFAVGSGAREYVFTPATTGQTPPG